MMTKALKPKLRIILEKALSALGEFGSSNSGLGGGEWGVGGGGGGDDRGLHWYTGVVLPSMLSSIMLF